MATSNAPVMIRSITLIVNNLDRMTDFYREVVGLNVIAKSDSFCTLGQGENALLHLEKDKHARVHPNEAGLFHTAFLLPSREALGLWLTHVRALGIRLDGAADHSVSEAIYLTDPEGNGIEVYADRDRSNWKVNGDLITLKSGPLDLVELASAGQGSWQGIPDGSVIGHVHLQVGDVGAADSFYRDKLGLAKTAHLGSAGFYSSGGYHHHLAANTWHSRGSGKRPDDATGFRQLELAVPVNHYAFDELTDPWGMSLRLSPTVGKGS